MTAADLVEETAVEPTYTSPQVCHLADVTYRQLDHWCRQGYLPEHQPGAGSQRRFDATELDTVRLVAHLIAAGFTVEAAFGIAARLVAEDRYVVPLADIFELSIRVMPTAALDGE